MAKTKKKGSDKITTSVYIDKDTWNIFEDLAKELGKKPSRMLAEMVYDFISDEKNVQRVRLARLKRELAGFIKHYDDDDSDLEYFGEYILKVLFDRPEDDADVKNLVARWKEEASDRHPEEAYYQLLKDLGHLDEGLEDYLKELKQLRSEDLRENREELEAIRKRWYSKKDKQDQG